MISTCPLISKLSSPFINSLGIVPSAPVTIDITVTFMFYSLFSSQARPRNLSLFAFFYFYYVVSRDSKVHDFSFFGCLSLDLVIWLRFGDLVVSQNPREIYASHFQGRILGCAFTTCSYGRILSSCTTPSGSPSSPSCV